jgi:hypothetical protein
MKGVLPNSPWNFFSTPALSEKREDFMDRCPHCNKRMEAVIGASERTELQCLQCDKVDPLKTDAVKWAENPLAKSTDALPAL